MEDVFAVQDEIATAIAGALQVKLLVPVVLRSYMPKIPAYEARLKARYYLGTAWPAPRSIASRRSGSIRDARSPE
jgi:hypothetical protein